MSVKSFEWNEEENGLMVKTFRIISTIVIQRMFEYLITFFSSKNRKNKKTIKNSDIQNIKF